MLERIASRTTLIQAVGTPVGVALVERRHDLALEQRVERLGVGRVGGGVVVGAGVAVDQPAVVAVVALGPPAVADAQVRHAVHRRLHAARAARLERLARVVQPHVAALHEVVRDVQVVVVDEGEAAAEDRIERAPEDALQVVLGRVVGRMRLAGEHDLHRPVRRRSGCRASRSGSWKISSGPLVGGEAPRVADRERVRVEHRAGGDDARRRRRAPTVQRWRAPLADEGEQCRAQLTPHLPRARRRGWRRSRSPQLRVVDAIEPVGAEVPVEQLAARRPPSRSARARRW